MSSSLNLKVRVKNGELSPREALKEMAESCRLRGADPDAALNSRTGRWLRSPNAERRYSAALKAGTKPETN